MSISVTTDVFCDGDNCRNWIAVVEGRVRQAGGEARAVARKAGWISRSGWFGDTFHESPRDLCPRCARLLQVPVTSNPD